MNIKKIFTSVKILQVNDYTGKERVIASRYFKSSAQKLVDILNNSLSINDYYILDTQLVDKKNRSLQSGKDTGVPQQPRKTGRDPLDHL